jgi:hypothetical protein
MMGHKETMTVATEEKGGGTLRRMVLVLAAAALIAAIMVALASPAFAQAQVVKERDPGSSNSTLVTTPSGKVNLIGTGLAPGQGPDGGGANVDKDAQFGPLSGHTVTTPSDHLNGTFHS